MSDVAANNDVDEVIDRVLATARTIAVVGLSRNPSKDAHRVPAWLQGRGYRIIPINPYADELLGERVYRNVVDVPEPIDIVDVFRPGPETPNVVRAAIAAGARSVWLQLGISSPVAAAIAAEAGVDYVEDRCLLVEVRDRDVFPPAA
jgi:predicted CoA-binding protein